MKNNFKPALSLRIALFMAITVSMALVTVYSLISSNNTLKKEASGRISSALTLAEVIYSNEKIKTKEYAELYAMSKAVKCLFSKSSVCKKNLPVSTKYSDMMLVFDTEKKILFSTNLAENFSDDFNNNILIEKALQGQAVVSTETLSFQMPSQVQIKSETKILSFSAAAPVYCSCNPGLVSGVIFIRNIINEKLLIKMMRLLEVNVAIYENHRLLVTNIPDKLRLGSKAGEMNKEIAKIVLEQGKGFQEAVFLSSGYFSKYSPIINIDNKAVGAIMVRISSGDYVKKRDQSIINHLIVALLGAILGYVLAIFIQRQIFARISTFMKETLDIAEGRQTTQAKYKQGTGDLVLFFNKISSTIIDYNVKMRDLLQSREQVAYRLNMEIKEHKKTEIALRESKERYEVLFEESPMSLWEEDFSAIKSYLEGLKVRGVQDLNKYLSGNLEEVKRIASLGRVVDVNRETLNLYEAVTKDEVKQNFSQTFRRETYIFFLEELLALASGRTEYQTEATTKTLRGNNIYVSLKIVIPPGYEQTWERVFISIIDITKLKEIEQELMKHRYNLEEMVENRTQALAKANKKLQNEILVRKKMEDDLKRAKETAELANKSQSMFLANMSHELRTPMNIIMGFSRQGIKNSMVKEREKMLSYFEHILTSSERLMLLIQDLLNLSMLESGKMQYNFGNNDIMALVKPIVDDCKQLYKQKNVDMVIKKIGVSTNAYFDPVRIDEVLRKLIDNAIQFCKKGKSINIWFSEESMQNKQYLKVHLLDQGIGIPEDELGAIFDKFIQSSKTSTGAGGTGLGLAICKKIIKDHHGEIYAKNNENGGAMFYFCLPKFRQEKV